jgi:hypothetical protein
MHAQRSSSVAAHALLDAWCWSTTHGHADQTLPDVGGQLQRFVSRLLRGLQFQRRGVITTHTGGCCPSGMLLPRSAAGRTRPPAPSIGRTRIAARPALAGRRNERSAAAGDDSNARVRNASPARRVTLREGDDETARRADRRAAEDTVVTHGLTLAG